MRQIVPGRALLATLILGFAAGPGAPASHAGSPLDGSTPGASYTSAKECAACHESIHGYWSESAHAQSASRSGFLESLSATLLTASDKAARRRECVWCHAPTALVSGDWELRQPISQEGVTCDFCHTVADVDLDKAGQPFELKPGNVKYGPLQYAESSFHETAYSPLHKASPLLCVACHEHTNELGVAVLSTYSEWKDSPYAARGVTCQECHMPTVPGATVREGLQATQRVINLHRIVGGSAASKLRTGLELRIDSMSRTSVATDVQVVVTNTGVGHAAPGGLSTKTLVLAVGVETARGELLHRKERIYGRELKDAQGRALSDVADLFVKAAAVGEDTRIRPSESRRERFTVPVPEGARAIVARLEYRDSSDPKAGPQTMLVVEERRELSSR